MNDKKVNIRRYSKKFPIKYEEEKARLAKEGVAYEDIHHIGSTSVPGLPGKGIIDILIGV